MFSFFCGLMTKEMQRQQMKRIETLICCPSVMTGIKMIHRMQEINIVFTVTSLSLLQIHLDKWVYLFHLGFYIQVHKSIHK